jgi:hypothetical protein
MGQGWAAGERGARDVRHRGGCVNVVGTGNGKVDYSGWQSAVGNRSDERSGWGS